MDGRRTLLYGMAAAAALGGAVAAAIVADGRDASPVTTAVVVTVETVATLPPATETVVLGVPVPPVVGLPLDEASALLEAAGLGREIDGGGLFGVLDETRWTVCAASPAPGERVAERTVVTVSVDRSCP